MNRQIDAVIVRLRSAIAALQELKTGPEVVTALARVVFCSPVTGKIEPVANPFGGDWFDATGFGKLYNSSGIPAYHTGVDLNRPAYADCGAKVYAVADGVIAFAGVVAGWQGNVIVLRHILEDGALIWTRYAHVDTLADQTGLIVRRGDALGCIADYNRDGQKGDHLHFDVARIDLGKFPGDWPGRDLGRVKDGYFDPAAWLRERAQ